MPTVITTKKRFRKALIFVVSLLFFYSLFLPVFVSAQSLQSITAGKSNQGTGNEIPVSEKELQKKVDQFKQSEKAADEEYKQERNFLRKLQQAADIAFKESLHYLLNTFAYDTASWLASGGEGQTPQFYTDGWGDYLLNVADAAAGEFISSLGKDWLGLNVCNPDLNVKLSIGLGLDVDYAGRRPTQQACGIKQAVSNWGTFLQDPNFADRVVAEFNPNQNDFLVALNLFGKRIDVTGKKLQDETKQREEGEGQKPIWSKISEKILTPPLYVNEEAKELIREGNFESEKVRTGDIIADAINTFTSTLAGKLLQRLFREGLALLRGDDNDSGSKSGNSSLYSLGNRRRSSASYLFWMPGLLRADHMNY